jgi:hypothetical protein
MKLTVTILFFSFAFLFPKFIYAQQYTEYELKSAYIFNFAKFIDYPPNAFNSDKDPFIIGVYGNDAFLEVLQTVIRGKTINNRSIIAISISQPDDAVNCKLLFFSKTTKNQTATLLEFLNGKSILTVGDDIEDFCQKGGMINFTPQYSHKRFEINPDAATRANISISSKLLALARIVKDEEVKF